MICGWPVMPMAGFMVCSVRSARILTFRSMILLRRWRKPELLALMIWKNGNGFRICKRSRDSREMWFYIRNFSTASMLFTRDHRMILFWREQAAGLPGDWLIISRKQLLMKKSLLTVEFIIRLTKWKMARDQRRSKPPKVGYIWRMVFAIPRPVCVTSCICFWRIWMNPGG